ncbi:probable lysophospholipase BODYGUARD 4 [Henckelia pumila]|uniref:probable lysophospholipase BODYGUARD 4 n=1 Tax=Henckelia pumila TaxID=405737 RepID=UPI003C6DC4B9
MCVFFRFFDGFLEGECSPCYCMKRPGMIQENKDDFLELERDNELSESLHGRRNLFREMVLLRNPRVPSKKEGLCVGELKNRWSDCGCESCVSWMSKGSSDFRLHVIVKESPKARRELCSQESSVQNVILIHGFLSSSSFWMESLFLNLSEHTNQKYRIFAVDLLGFGSSPKPKNCSYALKEHLEMVEVSVIRQFRLSSYHFVAHSMGCVIALSLAAKHSKSVKSITLIAPPYFSSSKGDASLVALESLAMRRVWSPVLFVSALILWYEHLGRCVCFFICRNHKAWEWILKLLTRTRDLHFSIIDTTRHTHHSAWHTMHNVICGGAKLLDGYLEVLTAARVKIHVVQGTRDRIVPIECSFNMKAKAPHVELEIVPNADHNSVIFGREKEFIMSLECVGINLEKIAAEHNMFQKS